MPSLLPERAITFSPSLAATLGLEEAVMLQGLQEISLHARTQIRTGDRQWQHAEQVQLRQMFPFWTEDDVERVVQSLVQKGVVQLNSGAYSEVKHLYFAFNDGGCAERRASAQGSGKQRPGAASREMDAASRKMDSAIQQQDSSSTQATASNLPGSKQPLPANWQPDADTLKQLAQHGVDAPFAQQQLAEFQSYWQQRGETAYAWGNKFLKHVLHEWRRHQANTSRGAPMQRQWRPSEDAMEILLRIDINKEFIEDAIPEFVLYWRERGDGISTWNTKFIAHVKKQWARFNASLEYDSEPKALPDNWQPNQDVYDILAMANIDLGFARDQLAEFKLFWHDNRQLHSSWNTKFLQHVKYRWARQHQFDSSSQPRLSHAQQQQSDQRRPGQASPTFERLTDRSWASSL